MELTDEQYNSIMNDLDVGDEKCESEDFEGALDSYSSALSKVPQPKTDWGIALHVYVALGDCYFNLKDYGNANENYNKALMCPDGKESGYVWLGLGQSYFELNDKEKAKDALMSAYMMEGEEIFQGEDDKYFDVIKGTL